MKLCTGNDTESVENEDEQRSQHNATSPFLRLPLEIKAIIHKTVCGNRPSISTRTIGHMRSTTMMTIHITASKPISGIIHSATSRCRRRWSKLSSILHQQHGAMSRNRHPLETALPSIHSRQSSGFFFIQLDISWLRMCHQVYTDARLFRRNVLRSHSPDARFSTSS